MKYPCKFSKEGCENAGNKYYNQGFMSGTASFCRLKNKWVANIDKCPKEEKEK